MGTFDDDFADGDGEFDVVGWAQSLSDEEAESIGRTLAQRRGFGRSPGGGRGGGGGGRGGGGGGGRGGGMMQHAPGRGGSAAAQHVRNLLAQHGGNLASMLPPGVPHPNWLAQTNPFGIGSPVEGLIQLPMAPVDNVGILTAATTAIKYLGRVQRPFRGERVVATLSRQGTTAQALEVDAEQGIVVGVVPQQAQVGAVSLEEWAGGNFGVRMAMNVAYPGIDITCNVQLVGTLTAPDQIVTRITIYGRYVG